MRALQLVDAHKRFGDRPVLTGVSLELEQGEVTCVVGRSGSGKSVLCRSAVGLVRLDRGEVHLLQQRVDRLGERRLLALRRQAPYLVQSDALLDWLDLAENVMRVQTQPDRGNALAVLGRLGLRTLAHAYPRELSPGMRKRAAIARALALSPRYLLLDEPTTGLSVAGAEEVHSAIRSLRAEGLGALVVTHDYRPMRELADRVVVLAKGKVVFDGTPDAFFASAHPEVRALTHPSASITAELADG